MTDETPKPPSALEDMIEWAEDEHGQHVGGKAARAELAALREDRERLEWIEAERAVVAPLCDAPGFNVVDEDGDGFDGLTLRAALDAARRRTT